MNSYPRLAPLFRYPDRDLAQIVVSVPELRDFGSEIEKLPLSELQATYTATFDLAPSCSPYLGVHLFGDENRDRGRLMVGLRQSYERVSMRNDAELPDHIAEVFAFAEHAPPDEWRDLESLVIKPALQKMNDILATTANPYRHLINAALLQVNRGPRTEDRGPEPATAGGPS